MTKRDHLRRLPPEYYRGDAMVHWSLTIRDRRLGWLDAMKHFRKTLGETLSRIGFELQDQSFDHILKGDERSDIGFRTVCEYIARNPEGAALVPVDGFASYPYTGCSIPGYPELRPFETGFWDKFDRIVSFLKKNGLQRLHSP